MSAARFTLSRHDLPGAPHLDLFLEPGGDAGAILPATDGKLATWRLPSDPWTWPVGEPVPVERLPDHRAAYLDHEGPVSGNRGTVAILARGVWNTGGDSAPAAGEVVVTLRRSGPGDGNVRAGGVGVMLRLPADGAGVATRTA